MSVDSITTRVYGTFPSFLIIRAPQLPNQALATGGARISSRTQSMTKTYSWAPLVLHIFFFFFRKKTGQNSTPRLVWVHAHATHRRATATGQTTQSMCHNLMKQNPFFFALSLAPTKPIYYVPLPIPFHLLLILSQKCKI